MSWIPGYVIKCGGGSTVIVEQFIQECLEYIMHFMSETNKSLLHMFQMFIRRHQTALMDISLFEVVDLHLLFYFRHQIEGEFMFIILVQDDCTFIMTTVCAYVKAIYTGIGDYIRIRLLHQQIHDYVLKIKIARIYGNINTMHKIGVSYLLDPWNLTFIDTNLVESFRSSWQEMLVFHQWRN